MKLMESWVRWKLFREGYVPHLVCYVGIVAFWGLLNFFLLFLFIFLFIFFFLFFFINVFVFLRFIILFFEYELGFFAIDIQSYKIYWKLTANDFILWFFIIEKLSLAILINIVEINIIDLEAKTESKAGWGRFWFIPKMNAADVNINVVKKFLDAVFDHTSLFLLCSALLFEGLEKWFDSLFDGLLLFFHEDIENFHLIILARDQGVNIADVNTDWGLVWAPGDVQLYFLNVGIVNFNGEVQVIEQILL